MPKPLGGAGGPLKPKGREPEEEKVAEDISVSVPKPIASSKNLQGAVTQWPKGVDIEKLKGVFQKGLGLDDVKHAAEMVEPGKRLEFALAIAGNIDQVLTRKDIFAIDGALLAQGCRTEEAMVQDLHQLLVKMPGEVKSFCEHQALGRAELSRALFQATAMLKGAERPAAKLVIEQIDGLFDLEIGIQGIQEGLDQGPFVVQVLHIWLPYALKKGDQRILQHALSSVAEKSFKVALLLLRQVPQKFHEPCLQSFCMNRNVEFRIEMFQGEIVARALEPMPVDVKLSVIKRLIQDGKTEAYELIDFLEELDSDTVKMLFSFDIIKNSPELVRDFIDMDGFKAGVGWEKPEVRRFFLESTSAGTAMSLLEEFTPPLSKDEKRALLLRADLNHSMFCEWCDQLGIEISFAEYNKAWMYQQFDPPLTVSEKEVVSKLGEQVAKWINGPTQNALYAKVHAALVNLDRDRFFASCPGKISAHVPLQLLIASSFVKNGEDWDLIKAYGGQLKNRKFRERDAIFKLFKLTDCSDPLLALKVLLAPGEQKPELFLERANIQLLLNKLDISVSADQFDSSNDELLALCHKKLGDLLGLKSEEVATKLQNLGFNLIQVATFLGNLSRSGEYEAEIEEFKAFIHHVDKGQFPNCRYTDSVFLKLFPKPVLERWKAIDPPMPVTSLGVPISKTMEEYTISRTDRLKDYLEMAEVGGSCLSRFANAVTSHLWGGHVYDGQNQMVALHDKDGKLRARAIFRLMKVKSTDQPALYLEKIYSDTHDEDGDLQIFSEFAKQQGALFKLPVFAHSWDEDLSIDLYGKDNIANSQYNDSGILGDDKVLRVNASHQLYDPAAAT